MTLNIGLLFWATVYKLGHVFHAYNLQHLIFAFFGRRLIQHWIDCMQFFIYIILH